MQHCVLKSFQPPLRGLLPVKLLFDRFERLSVQRLQEARGKAAVHLVIIGFANFDVRKKTIWNYDDVKGEPLEINVKNINPYLVEGKDLVILKRRKSISNVSDISFGSMPKDGGNFLLTEEEKNELIKIEPNAEQVIKPTLSARKFLNGKRRFCIWLEGVSPGIIKQLKEVLIRVNNVKELRFNSNRVATNKLAAFPTLFGEIRQPKNNYVLVPCHSSENRPYVPMGFFSSSFIVNNSCLAIDNATLYEFGVLHSEMHMAWVNLVCGRLESRYRYSDEIV